MKDLWHGCPNCFLAFSDEGEFGRHHDAVHLKKKFRPASKLASTAISSKAANHSILSRPVWMFSARLK
jgi:hypothetical protein